MTFSQTRECACVTGFRDKQRSWGDRACMTNFNEKQGGRGDCACMTNFRDEQGGRGEILEICTGVGGTMLL